MARMRVPGAMPIVGRAGFRFGRGGVRSNLPKTKKDWVTFNTTAPMSTSSDTRLIVVPSTSWVSLGSWDEPAVIRILGSATVWSEDDDVTDAAVLFRIAMQCSKKVRSANPRPLSEGYDSDFKWLAGGTLINSGAGADQIHAWGRVCKFFFDFNPKLKVVDDDAEISMALEVDNQSGSLGPVLCSFEGRMLISAGY